MIENQSIEILHDRDRNRHAVFIARDPESHQLYQIPLIDAWIGAIDYLPQCPYLIVPSLFRGTGNAFP